ncbi:hypothetical protein ORJ04_21895 [Rheinheimera baltica]|uniref:Bypass of forespore C C-terminal domain-containing protein n=1 Tax=Rheinheimera baltica TaxID=67576 RepID=A0ABT9I5G4_9GAMM|nr:hypothetical protein [Rheinheimera baltica]MDP5138604.1 hypothetical protein [Rheinheimera baltica]MDP5152066.1 hypothetical protein [Rheinheimera baltica]
MIRQVLTILFLLFLSARAEATAQSPDKILINGEEFSLNTNPLESFLQSVNWEPPEEAVIWSSNWRGYLATWEIKNESLVLVNMTIEIDSDPSKDKRERRCIIETVFPEKKQVVADWFNGALIIPDGEMTNYVHMGYGSTYEKYQIINIKSGSVIGHLNMSHSEFLAYRDKKFQAFKQTEMFKAEFINLVDGEYDWSEEQALEFMQSYYAEHYLSL